MKHLLKNLPGQLHGEIKTTVVTVSGGPTLLPSDPSTDRKDFLLYNGSPDTVYVGGSDVTSTNGIPVSSDGSFSMQAGRVDVYATVSGSNQDVRVMEVS